MPYCPCGNNRTYQECCKPFHDDVPAPTAEALMRSRYGAFDLELVKYLIDTHHPSKRANDDREVLGQTIANTQWLKLQIVDTQQGQIEDSTGTVEFIATFEENQQLGQLHERSRFVKEDNRWYYLDGEILPTELKVGRNDLCPCGSGKKLKKCHG